MRHLSPLEACELIEQAWNLDGPTHQVNEDLFEVTLLGASIDDVTTDVELFIDSLGDEIDPNSIKVVPDMIEGGCECCLVTIRARGAVS